MIKIDNLDKNPCSISSVADCSEIMYTDIELKEIAKMCKDIEKVVDDPHIEELCIKYIFDSD